MSINLLTDRQAVLDAIAEYDEFGRDVFLEKYGYGSAKSYFVQHNGRPYDSKAIIGVAVGKQFPERGPLRNNEFSGGDTVRQKLTSLGFDFVEEVRITSADIALITEARAKSRYAHLSDDERNAYIRITSALKTAGQMVLATLGETQYQLKLTSGFHLGSGVRGAIPKDLWFGIYAKDNADAFAGSPQLFMIVSERGVELGFAASTHPSGFSDASIKAKVRAAAPQVFDRMPIAESKDAKALGDGLAKSGAWHFRRQTRLTPNQSDWAGLSEWLSFLHSVEGRRAGGLSISKYLLPSEVEDHDLLAECYEMTRVFQPLMDDIRADRLPGQSSSSSQGAAFASLATTFLKEFSKARQKPFSVIDPLWRAASQLRQWLAEQSPISTRPALRVSWSPGKGVWSRVPWVGILNRNVTSTTQKGLYCVFLISQDLSTVYLTLAQGVTELTKELGPIEAGRTLEERAARFRSSIGELSDRGFALRNDINLACDGRLAKGYQQSVIAYVGFDATNLPADETLLGYLEPLLSAYDRLAASEPKASDQVTEEGWEPVEDIDRVTSLPPYSVDEAMADLFLSKSEFERILDVWRSKKNLVLQGAPGVGKTFIARRLAYALIGAADKNRVQSVQFHQSYGYEDFVQGYRPDGSGGFVLKDGSFFEFCQRARVDSQHTYVFIIDEINRGNLSKIFGELMLLIEYDKRNPEWAAQLAYSSPEDPKFYVPENVFVIGMMNTADRSLSLVDYALRRRFSFVTLEPQFTSSAFRATLQSLDVSDIVIKRVSERMTDLNAQIAADTINLGRGFRIGHSFFVPDKAIADSEAWYQRVIETEVCPLLDEYWLDDSDKVVSLSAALLQGSSQ